MHIIVIGIGGVGGYFGGRLALTGHRVEFVARGLHGKTIAADGLKVKSVDGDFIAYPDQVHSSLETIEAPDLVLICTKSWQLEAIGKELKSRINRDTVILPLQNGVSSVERLIKHVPEQQVLGGLCKIISKMEQPGVIDHFAFHPEIIFGEVDGSRSERTVRLEALFRSAKIDARISEDIRLDMWRKFLFICVISGMGALCRQEIGVMREDAGIRELMERSAEEILEVAAHKGVGLTRNDMDRAFRAIDAQEYHSTASLQRDMMDGKPSEIHDFNGYIVQEAARLGLSVPVNTFIYYTLRPMEEQAREKKGKSL
ncbi:ketopantoate reductase family protein [Robertkochia flava]|uniref:ketopantoate reductase family protein n=1 Tax=Robertkochia flava TaxID=3447986 RepID=UPI001CC96A3E|nr:2-dehydropantoate 2-reductase [Robertkochia marina]